MSRERYVNASAVDKLNAPSRILPSTVTVADQIVDGPKTTTLSTIIVHLSFFCIMLLLNPATDCALTICTCVLTITMFKCGSAGPRTRLVNTRI